MRRPMVPLVARPREGKVTLTVDPKYTVRLRGLVTDSSGQRIAGAKVSLWWTRWYPRGKEGRPTMATSSVLETYTTSEDGLFVFRGLWPEDRYNVVVEARGHKNGESSKLTGKLGETHDLGKIVLINTDAASRRPRRRLRWTADRRRGSVQSRRRARAGRDVHRLAGPVPARRDASRNPSMSSSARRDIDSPGSRTRATPTA